MIRENSKQLLKRLSTDMFSITKLEIEKYPSMWRVTLFLGRNGTRYHINKELFDFLKPLFFIGDIAVVHPDTSIEELMKDKEKMTLTVHSSILKYQNDNGSYWDLIDDPVTNALFKVYESAEERLKELIDEKRIGMSPLGPGQMYLNYIHAVRKRDTLKKLEEQNEQN